MTPVLASASPTFPVLPALIVVPLLGALLVVVVPRRRTELLKLVAVLATMATGALSLWLLFAFDTGVDGFQFASRHVWLGDLGVSWLFGIDGISLFLVVLTGVLFPIAILATDPEHDGRAYYAWLLVLEGGVMGVFASLDLVVFFLCLGLATQAAYLRIGAAHQDRAGERYVPAWDEPGGEY